MKHLLQFTILFLLLFSCSVLHAQFNTANRLYNQLKYSKAIPFYLKTVTGKNDKDKQVATEKLADCYRLTNNYAEAINWYKQALTYKTADPVSSLNYGIVLRTTGNYQEAANYFERYLASNPDDEEAKFYLDYCRQIFNWLELPKSASYENESALNSEYSDFSPTLYEKGLVIVSDRMVDKLDNHNYSWTGNGYLDLYFAAPDGSGNLEKPAIMSKTFNQSFHDGPVSFSPDEQVAYITRTAEQKRYKKDSVQTHFSFVSVIDLSAPKKSEKPFIFNHPKYSVGHTTISPDGTTLIFVSSKEDGFGKSDLYSCKSENGAWSEPVNMGAKINTLGKELFPYLADEKTLYFSSEGHMGYGGLDIFMSELKNGEWQEPVNLKAPINSSYDDFGILFIDSKSGYFSSDRPGGQGSDDIYNFSEFTLIPNPSDSKK